MLHVLFFPIKDHRYISKRYKGLRPSYGFLISMTATYAAGRLLKLEKDRK